MERLPAVCFGAVLARVAWHTTEAAQPAALALASGRRFALRATIIATAIATEAATSAEVASTSTVASHCHASSADSSSSSTAAALATAATAAFSTAAAGFVRPLEETAAAVVAALVESSPLIWALLPNGQLKRGLPAVA